MNPELSLAHEQDDAPEGDVTPDSIGGIPLGQLLLEAGVLTEDVLDEVLEKQARTGRRLGEILVGDGYVSSRVMANALAEQHGGMLRNEYGVALGMKPGDTEGIPYSPPPATPESNDDAPRATAADAPRAPQRPIAQQPVAFEKRSASERPPLFKANAALDEPSPAEEAPRSVEPPLFKTTAPLDEPAPAEEPPAPAEDRPAAEEPSVVDADEAPTVEGPRPGEIVIEAPEPEPEPLFKRVRVEEVAEQLAEAHADLDEARSQDKHDRLTQALAEAEDRATAAEARAAQAEAELAPLQERVEELEAELKAATEPAQAQPPLSDTPVPAVPLQDRHLLFVPTDDGYHLREEMGPMPSIGTAVELDGSHFAVVRVGPSPLPGDPASCAFLILI